MHHRPAAVPGHPRDAHLCVAPSRACVKSVGGWATRHTRGRTAQILKTPAPQTSRHNAFSQHRVHAPRYMITWVTTGTHLPARVRQRQMHLRDLVRLRKAHRVGDGGDHLRVGTDSINPHPAWALRWSNCIIQTYAPAPAAPRGAGQRRTSLAGSAGGSPRTAAGRRPLLHQWSGSRSGTGAVFENIRVRVQTQSMNGGNRRAARASHLFHTHASSSRDTHTLIGAIALKGASAGANAAIRSSFCASERPLMQTRTSSPVYVCACVCPKTDSWAGAA